MFDIQIRFIPDTFHITHQKYSIISTSNQNNIFISLKDSSDIENKKPKIELFKRIAQL